MVELPISWDLDVFNLRGEPHPLAANGVWVTPGYVEGFGLRPVLGRNFEAADFESGRPPVALISHRLWQTRFAGDPGVLGRQFEAYMNDRPDEVEAFTVIGVLPERLWHLNAYTEVMAPLRGPSYPYMVRLRAGVSPETAAGRINSLIRSGNPGLPPQWRASLLSTHAAYVEQIRPLLLSLSVATGLVLLIACANVAVLLLVRATERRREIAVRQALGASSAQVVRALFAEGLALGGLATAFGLSAARLALKSLAPVIERGLGRGAPGGPEALAPDGLLLMCALAVGAFITLICSAAPAWVLRRAPLAPTLSAGYRGGTAAPAQQRARAALIATEVGACLTLLVGAALMVQSGLRVLDVDMGIQDRGVLVGRLSLRERDYPDPAARAAFHERAEASVRAVPGVTGTAFANWWPLQQPSLRDVGLDRPARAGASRAGVVRVSAGYFETLGIALRDGRTFASPEGRPGSEPAAVVSESLARRLWPGQRAIGQRVRVWPQDGDLQGSPLSCSVVGVASDTRQSHTDRELLDVYLALSQQPSLAVFTYVRAEGPPLETERRIREALARVDPNVPLGTPRPLSDILDQQRTGPRFIASLLTAFSLLSGLFALIGLYGVIAYAVQQRTREIALRLAIGADRAAITRLFVGQGASVLSGGLLAGVGGALGLGKLLESQLFDVRASDPYVISVVTAAFALCGLLAVAWPARRAASTDPAAALRE